ncbi:MAG: hypothetical protein LBV51_05270 [Acholeplasmatales bacterium]|jgi:hypothetical protein|nr:hypothetical protein [Acholeplasmatales bacterium]
MIKRIFKHYKLYLVILITLGFIALSVFLYYDALYRLLDSFKDIGLSIAYYFCSLFDIKYSFSISVTMIPNHYGILSGGGTTPPNIIIPVNFDLFKIKIMAYFKTLFTLDSFLSFISLLLHILQVLAKVLLVVAPFLLLIYFKYKQYFKPNNNKTSSDSKYLYLYKLFITKAYTPIKKWILNFIAYIKSKRIILILWIIVWCFNFNIFTIVLEFISFYFYFIFSLDFGNIYIQFYKLILDLIPMFKSIPLVVWVMLGLILIYKIRLSRGYAKLNHNEYKNRGLINSLGQVVLICGNMNKGKTSLMTDMSLSQDIMFKDKAFELLLEEDLKFPYFPYINLEKCIKNLIRKHIVYNLATLTLFIKRMEVNFSKHSNSRNCFNYNFKLHGLYYKDNLSNTYLYSSLLTYSKLYFIYIVESSLLVTNYSIRTDNILYSLSNFPLWNTDFFKKNVDLQQAYTRHSHILDFDSLRLGKTLVSDNKKRNSFEFGVICISEVGKERGNMLDLKETKINTLETNQKNDLFNLWLKMARHSATVSNYPFIKVYLDEQRESSLGADARDLCEKIVYIKEKHDKKNHLLFFIFEEIINDFLLSKFRNIYYNYRYNRSDNTLLFYLLKIVVSKFKNHYSKLNNTFSYYPLTLELENGVEIKEFSEHNYYLSFKKLYSNRFSTDAFSDYFTYKSLCSSIGINDLEEFRETKASLDELSLENSYFINNLLEHLDKIKRSK